MTSALPQSQSTILRESSFPKQLRTRTLLGKQDHRDSFTNPAAPYSRGLWRMGDEEKDQAFPFSSLVELKDGDSHWKSEFYGDEIRPEVTEKGTPRMHITPIKVFGIVPTCWKGLRTVLWKSLYFFCPFIYWAGDSGDTFWLLGKDIGTGTSISQVVWAAL